MGPTFFLYPSTLLRETQLWTRHHRPESFKQLQQLRSRICIEIPVIPPLNREPFRLQDIRELSIVSLAGFEAELPSIIIRRARMSTGER